MSPLSTLRAVITAYEATSPVGAVISIRSGAMPRRGARVVESDHPSGSVASSAAAARRKMSTSRSGGGGVEVRTWRAGFSASGTGTNRYYISQIETETKDFLNTQPAPLTPTLETHHP